MLEKIAMILKENECPYDGLTGDTELIADIGLNSMKIIELVGALEDTFDIEIPDRSIKSLRTINDVISLIDSL